MSLLWSTMNAGTATPPFRRVIAPEPQASITAIFTSALIASMRLRSSFQA